MAHALIIDDSSTVRLYYREVLEAASFAVDEAINGFEGLEKTMNHSFDLIIVDVNMPKMDGYTFLNQLRRAPEVQYVPVIMISTEAREADQVKAYAVGANFYLVKPVNPDELTICAKLMTGLALAQLVSA
jgi:two-component system chemotaxis response regulator CheY